VIVSHLQFKLGCVIHSFRLRAADDDNCIALYFHSACEVCCNVDRIRRHLSNSSTGVDSRVVVVWFTVTTSILREIDWVILLVVSFQKEVCHGHRLKKIV
jgi:hypothetical protein